MKNGTTVVTRKTIRIVAFVLCLLYALLMIQLLFNRVSGPDWESYRYNLVPFRTIANYINHASRFNFDTWFKNLFGNIVLFIPIGIFAPALNRRFLRFLPFISMTVSILFAVEIIQLVTKVGSFDVDDLILNVFGAVIGFVSWTILRR